MTQPEAQPASPATAPPRGVTRWRQKSTGEVIEAIQLTSEGDWLAIARWSGLGLSEAGEGPWRCRALVRATPAVTATEGSWVVRHPVTGFTAWSATFLAAEYVPADEPVPEIAGTAMTRRIAVLNARSALLKAAHRVWLALNGDGRDADAESEYADELLALAARDLTRAVDRVPARDQPVGWRGEQAVTSLTLTTPTPAPPKMPPGIYGRAELPGFRSHVGWATDRVIGGQPCLVMSDRDGTVLGEYILGPASRFVRLEVPDVNAPSAVPRGVQDQVERQAITQDGTWYDDGWPENDDEQNPF